LWHINSIQVIVCTFPTCCKFNYHTITTTTVPKNNYTRWYTLMKTEDRQQQNEKIKKLKKEREFLSTGERGPSWSWSCGSWIYNYLCNQCFNTNVVDSTRAQMHWIHSLSVTCDMSLVFPGPTVSSTNNTNWKKKENFWVQEKWKKKQKTKCRKCTHDDLNGVYMSQMICYTQDCICKKLSCIYYNIDSIKVSRWPALSFRY
jgi:predicted transcriptional regulator